MKKFFTLSLSLLFTVCLLAQNVGDYQSNASANWTALSTWLRWDGANWVQPTIAEGYPGQNATSGLVTILAPHTVTINSATGANLITQIDLYGKLSVTGDWSLNFFNMEIFPSGPPPSLVVGGQLQLVGNSSLTIPVNAGIEFPPGYAGLRTDVNPCSNNTAIFIGTVKYGACAGGGNVCLTFSGINAAGGTFRVEPEIDLASSFGSGNSTCISAFNLNINIDNVPTGGVVALAFPNLPAGVTLNPSSFTGLTDGNADGTITATTAVTTPGAGTYMIEVEATLTFPDGGNSCTGFSAVSTATITIVVLPSPTSVISGTTTVCKGAASPNINFTNPSAAQIEVTYTINGGSNLTVLVPASSSANVAAPTGNTGVFVYSLVGSRFTSGVACAIPLTGSATVTVTDVTMLAEDEDEGSSNVNLGMVITTPSECKLIAKVAPQSALPVACNVTAKVWIEGALPYFNTVPFVPRHYQLNMCAQDPCGNYRVTLYFLQSEFDLFNSVPNGGPDLPMSADDAENLIPNLRVYKLLGTSSDGTGLPGTYPNPNPPIMIDPADADIVWNAAAGWWAVTFDTDCLTGGYLVGNETILILPLNLEAFTGKLLPNNQAELNWKTRNEVNVNRFEVEFSANGRTFAVAGDMRARNNGITNDYAFRTPMAGPTTYYRLKMIDNDGQARYSGVISLRNQNAPSINVFPNPATNIINIELRESKNALIRLLDLSGKIIQTKAGVQGMNNLDVSTLSRGMYMLEVLNNGTVERIKVMKQ